MQLFGNLPERRMAPFRCMTRAAAPAGDQDWKLLLPDLGISSYNIRGMRLFSLMLRLLQLLEPRIGCGCMR